MGLSSYVYAYTHVITGHDFYKKLDTVIVMHPQCVLQT